MQELWQPLSAIVVAVPCFTMAYTLGCVWRNPESVEEGRWVKIGVGVLIIEFLVIHSGGMLAGFGQKQNWQEGVALVMLIPLYLLFGWAVSYYTRSRQLFWSFILLLFGRLVAIILDDTGEALALMVQRTTVSVLIYFPLVFLSITSLIPHWGMADPKYAKAMQADGTTGVWAEHPHRAIGAATIYFFLLGIAELGYLSWTPL